MDNPFLGSIIIFAGTFAPRGWAFCDGQLLSIAQNTALFSILGTTYGGNGQTTFALPDLRGRVPVHAGASQGPGLSPRTLGEVGGNEAVTLSAPELPPHNHLVNCQSATGTQTTPSGNYPAGNQVNRDSGVAVDTTYEATNNATMSPNAIAAAGGGQPHNNMQPFLCLNFIIALEGIFPSRN